MPLHKEIVPRAGAAPADNANGSSKAIVNASLSWECCLLSLLVLQKFLNGAERRMLKTSIGHQAMTTKPQAQRQRQSEGMGCRDQRQAGLDEHPWGLQALSWAPDFPGEHLWGPSLCSCTLWWLCQPGKGDWRSQHTRRMSS